MSAYQTCPQLVGELAVAEGEDVVALEELWQKLDTQIRQTELNLRRLIKQKVRIEGRIVSIQKAVGA